MPSSTIPPDEPEAISLLDERAQRIFDDQQLVSTLEQVRRLLAAAKVNKLLAQNGLLEPSHDAHPRKFDAAIKMHRQTIDLLKGLAEELGDEGLPEFTIEVYAPKSMAEISAPEGT